MKNPLDHLQGSVVKRSRSAKPENHTPPDTIGDILEYCGRAGYLLQMIEGCEFFLVPNKWASKSAQPVPVNKELGEYAIRSGHLYHLTRFGPIANRAGWSELEVPTTEADYWCCVQ